MEATFLLTLLITFLASFIGYELISKIPQTLHTPLMSGSNAISGITLIAAILIYPEVGDSQLLKNYCFNCNSFCNSQYCWRVFSDWSNIRNV